MRMRFFPIVVLLLNATLSFADWTLTTAQQGPDGQFTTLRKLTINEWTMQGGLAYTQENGVLVQIPTRDVVTLAGDKAVKANPSAWELRLRNGDLLRGAPTGMREQFLDFRADDLGPLSVPLKQIAAMQHAETKNAAPSADQDTVLLKKW